MKVASESNIGLCRCENQDVVMCEVLDNSAFVVLCDGMGGENSGFDASNLAAEIVMSKFMAGYESSFTPNNIRNLLISTVNIANSVVYNTANTEIDKYGMGSTCVAAFIDGKTDTVHIVNVGDSRAYVCDESTIRQITTDHSFVQMLIDQGKITEQEKAEHPKKNMLIRAVGVEKDITVDYFETELKGGKLLLCSDGLHGCCNDDEIFQVINSFPTDQTAKELVDLALKKGGYDNVTIAVVENC